MKFLIFIVFAAGILHVNADKKLALITGLNGGGLVTGLNPGLAVAGLNPGLIMANPGLAVAGINPLLAGGGLIAQPQFAPMFPGFPTYLQPGAFPYVPRLAYPQMQPFPRPAFPANGGFLPPNNFGVQRGVIPGQQQAMGQPYYMGVPPPNTFGPQQRANPTQQRVMGTDGRPWNVNQQQGPAETGPIRRYRRTLPVKACAQVRHQNPTATAPPPTPTELLPVPKLLKMDD